MWINAPPPQPLGYISNMKCNAKASEKPIKKNLNISFLLSSYNLIKIIRIRGLCVSIFRCASFILKSQSGNFIPKKYAAKETNTPIKGTLSRKLLKKSIVSPHFEKKGEQVSALPPKYPIQVITIWLFLKLLQKLLFFHLLW